MKTTIQIALAAFVFIIMVSSCTREYSCQCTSTDLQGNKDTSISTIEAKSRNAAETVCEASSVDIVFVELECTLL